MNSVFAGAMITIMALCVFGVAIPLGGVTPELAIPAYALGSLLVLLWGFSLFRGGSWSKSPMHLPVVAFLVYATVRYFFAVAEYEARIELLQIWLAGLIYFCCASRFSRPVDRTILLVALLSLGVLESGYSMWQAFTKAQAVFIWERPPGYGTRASGTFIYPNHCAAFLGVTLSLAVARIFLTRREGNSTERSVLIKLLTLYAAAMVLAGIILTRSRGGWLAVGAGLFAFFLLGDWRPSFSWWRVVMAVAVLFVVGLAALNLDVVRDRILGSFKNEHQQITFKLGDRSLGGRTLMWKGSLEMIRDRPLLGTGPGSWQWVFQQYKKPDYDLLSRPDYAHNDYLNLACDYGLVGFGLVAWVFVGFFRHALVLRRVDRLPEERAFAVGVMVAVVMLLSHCVFDFPMHILANALVLAVLLGLTAAMDAPDRGIARVDLPVYPRLALGVVVLAACGWMDAVFFPTAMAFRCTDLGNRLKKELEYDAALAWYERAIELDPKNPEAPARIGDVNRTLALWRIGPEKQADRREFARKAAAAYDRSLQLNDRQSLVWSERGRVLLMADEEAEAVRSFERAIQAYPANGYPYFLLGCYYRDHDQVEKAKEFFLKADQITPAYSASFNKWLLDNHSK